MINVLVVEDDPMVASLNRQYVEKLDGFLLAGSAANAKEAAALLKEKSIDLILLDVYMPGLNGIDFLQEVRTQNHDIDVILITAASGLSQIQQALRLGAVDYLIKPFEFDRFKEALLTYKRHFHTIQNKAQISQQELDRLLREKQQPNRKNTVYDSLPKGLTKNTLQIINHIIHSLHPHPFSTEDVAEHSQISRVSVRKYLKFLTEIHYLEEHLIYGVGRPIYQYRLIKDNSNKIEPFL
ncbi:response regulator [Halobacillus salinarum]|uniref:Response regulator n=1 Tax=Halobacillus salinarum TaxID=2932257 RepID=A0ABY4EQL7_9BACI|nr:response regulator [Halobacillus salinarum]UOQ45962.1 response regulator [Halobacillus salinarum]